MSRPRIPTLLVVLALLAWAGCAGSDGAAAGPDPTAVGASAPAWSLPDFQPASEGFGTEYGLEAFAGRATLVAFLSGW